MVILIMITFIDGPSHGLSSISVKEFHTMEQCISAKIEIETSIISTTQKYLQKNII